MKKNRNRLLTIIMMLFLLVSLSSCSVNFKQYYTVILNDGEQTQSQRVEVDTTFTLDPITKDEYEFGGWFLDEEKTDGPYTTYTSSTPSTTTFYAKWITPIDENQEAAQEVIDLIATIPSQVMLEDEKQIEDINALYNSLSPEAKEYVTNISTLTDALQTIASLKQMATDTQLVKEVVDLINNLPASITIADEVKVNEIRAKYDALSSSNKAQVTNYQTLTQKEETIVELKASINEVITLISNLPSSITVADEVKVNEARAKYDALPTTSKTQVTNYQTLTQKEAQIEELKADIDEVITLISNLPSSVTVADEVKVNETRAKYDALPTASKTQVTNYQTLTQKEETIKELKADINEVIALISNLPSSVTVADEVKVNETRAKYDALPTASKTQVTNYQTLTQKEETIVELNASINEVITLISNLPSSITIEDKATVNTARTKYDALPELSKAQVTNYQILTQAEAKLLELDPIPTTITYNLGQNVYQSKLELFTAFFTDFYNFILSRDGGASLKNSNINTLEDFLDLASDPNGGGTTTMRGIGNIAGRYLLSRDYNGIMEDQSVETFVGYCVKNGLYKDLFPFFIRFFAYWRIDERYATLNNYGADFFAESWAPTVDIAKFFYYTEETSYVQTERMIDCFVNIASVVYGDLPNTVNGTTLTLSTEIKLRGYTFAGWYDNPAFSGDPITTVEEGKGSITLYAKWEIDQTQKDKDDAEFVDVYIYNLMPSVASPTKANVQKVRKLYNALSSNAKTLVTRYNTLLEFESQYFDELTSEKVIAIIIQKPVLFTSFASMKEQFLADFNAVTNANVTYSDFTTNRYTVMSHVKTFFDDDEMYTKWAFILTYFAKNPSASSGLVIQSNRALNRGTGDLEYVSKAIDGFFNETDLTADTEIKIDFTNSSEVISDSSLQKALVRTYTKEGMLPVLVIEGYTFKGYTISSDGTGDIYLTVTDDTATTLYAIFS